MEYPEINGLESESALELLASLKPRDPRWANLQPELFPPGILSEKSIVEIYGPYGSGKTILMTSFIANCILDADCGGCEYEGVLIDVDQHFNIERLAAMLRRTLTIKFPDDVERRMEASLERLHVFKCFNLNEFTATLISLENFLLRRSNVGCVFIDSISSFYWHVRSLDQFPVQVKDENPVFTKIAAIISRIAKEQRVSFFICCQALIPSLENRGPNSVGPTHFLGKLWHKLPSLRILTANTGYPNIQRLKLQIRERSENHQDLLPDVEKQFEMTTQTDSIQITAL